MGKIIGIDLGTTNSVVAVWEGGQATVIANAEGGRTTPSVVGFTEKDRLVGQSAKRQAVTNPENTVYSIKRFMGRRHSEVESEEKLVPYRVTGAPEELVTVEARGKKYTPQEISAMILQYLKKAAEDYLGHEVTDAVITVPAYFNDSQRQATKDAGRIAGLNVRRIINEPTAASLAYGLDKKKNEKIAVFDLGGGTFDISILEVGDGVFEVKSTNGDTHLGGDDFDMVVLDYLADEFKKSNGIDLRKDRMALQRLREAAEKAKCELSSAMSTEVTLPFITADASGPKHLQMTLSRALLEQLTAPLVERTRKPCEMALKDANLSPKDIDEVILVGGAIRMPAVQAIVKEIFGKEPNKSVNPDEVVAVGAAIQGGVLGQEVTDILLLDVTPLTLGIETLGGVMTPMIARNTTIPSEKEQPFSTADDNQTTVDVHVLQGERKFARDCRSLGRFQLTGIPPAPRGVPQILVKFSIDANGILHVTAKDRATGKENAIQIKSSSGLSENEIKEMVNKAQENAAEDERKAKLVEAQNHAEQAIYTTQRSLKEHGEKVTAEIRQNIEAAIERLKKEKEGENVEAITKAIEELTEASYKLGEAIYGAYNQQQQGQPGGPQGAPGGPGGPGGPDFGGQGGPGFGGGDPNAQNPEQAGPGGEKIYDADYTVVDDEEKKKNK